MEYLGSIQLGRENDVAKSCLNVPIEYQLAVLGINNRVIASLKGKHALDIGCGNGSLVNYLISQGIDARGIDSNAPEGPQFTRRWIIGLGSGGIPAADRSLDLIVAFQNTTLNHALATTRDSILSFPKSGEPFYEEFNPIRSIVDEAKGQAQYIISEIGRTLSNEGKAIIYPVLVHLDEHAGHLLRMDSLSHSRVRIKDRKSLISYLRWENCPQTADNIDKEVCRPWSEVSVISRK